MDDLETERERRNRNKQDLKIIIKWIKSRFLSTDEWIMNMWQNTRHMCTVEYYSAFKKNEIYSRMDR